MISIPIKAFKNKKLKIARPLNPTWNIHAVGFLAVANHPPMPWPLPEVNYSLDIEFKFFFTTGYRLSVSSASHPL